MERKLRAFAERANQDESEQDRIEAVGANLVARRQYGIQIVAADNMAEQHDPCQQAQPSRACDHQCHVSATACIRAVVPVPNQQK